MPADPKILPELKESFELEPPETDDYEKISNAFSEGPENHLVMQGLESLENALAAQMMAAEKRAMGHVLLASEKLWGINTDADGSVRITILRMLEPEEFGAQFRLGQLFKDPGAMQDHGEYTHRIQWYIISTQNIVEDPNTVLASMWDHLATSGNANGLWDCLLDRLRYYNGIEHFRATGKTDFRSPEHFNLWMMKQSDYPTLSLFLNGRFEKRQINMEIMTQIAGWLDTNKESEAAEKLLECVSEDGAAAAFSIPYALKKAGNTVVGATEDQMLEAIAAYKIGTIRLDP